MSGTKRRQSGFVLLWEFSSNSLGAFVTLGSVAKNGTTKQITHAITAAAGQLLTFTEATRFSFNFTPTHRHTDITDITNSDNTVIIVSEC